MPEYVLDRGEIVFTDFDPVRGHEQAMKRPALVLTPRAFNKKVGLALVVPITSRIRGHAFEVPLEGIRTTGVVLCHQIKMIDYRARGVRKIDVAANTVLQDAMARIRALVS